MREREREYNSCTKTGIGGFVIDNPRHLGKPEKPEARMSKETPGSNSQENEIAPVRDNTFIFMALRAENKPRTPDCSTVPRSSYQGFVLSLQRIEHQPGQQLGIEEGALGRHLLEL